MKLSKGKELKPLADPFYLSPNNMKRDRIMRIYEAVSFDRMDRLTEADAEYYNQLKVVMGIMEEHMSFGAQAKAVNQQYPEVNTAAQMRSLIIDAKQLFGCFVAFHDVWDRMVVAERLIKNADACKNAADFENERKALEAYAKLMGIQRVNEIKKPELPAIPEITFTSNPKVLEQQSIEEAEVVED